MIPLQATAIQKAITCPSLATQIEILCFESTPSTQEILKTYSSPYSVVLCCAETQTQGRGRMNRHWVSPFGENIYCSLRVTLSLPLVELHHFSLVVGLACVASLQPFCPATPLGLKWPNDIVVQKKKLGGILIEMMRSTSTQTTFVIGFGVNINQTPTLEDDPRSVTSVYDLTKQPHDRNKILGGLVSRIGQYLANYETAGWAQYESEWEKVDVLRGQALTYLSGGEQIQGKAIGLNEKGHLILEQKDGRMHFIIAGALSYTKL